VVENQLIRDMVVSVTFVQTQSHVNVANQTFMDSGAEVDAAKITMLTGILSAAIMCIF